MGSVSGRGLGEEARSINQSTIFVEDLLHWSRTVLSMFDRK